jgi:single-strand DNA-binding protein
MNSLTIAGVLGKDPELKQVGQDQVLSFTVADSQGKEKPTLWWNCQMWGKRATTLQQYMAKGQKVTVSGNIQMREYTDKNGDKKTAMDVRVNDVALQGGGEQQRQAIATPKTAQQPQRGPASHAPSQFDMDDSQIPF